ncbi:MAG: DUF2000 domain-containing protein [Nitrospira sp.]|nr:DUF2000 domain-containing protein [Nitrospira sp.]
MSYDYSQKKIVAVLSSNLDFGVALNIIGHMAVALGAYGEKDLMGRSELLDGSGIRHIGIARYPFIVTKVRPARLQKFVQDARKDPNLFLVDFPRQMLTTGHDDDLAEALLETKGEAIDYLGALVYGSTAVVSSLTGKFSLWKADTQAQ